MADEKETTAVVFPPATGVSDSAEKKVGGEKGGTHGLGARDDRFRRRPRRSFRREERVRSEFDQKILEIRRVTRVVAGGRRFSFSVAIVIGNKKGSVGVGMGKASDTSLAIEKAARQARKHLVSIPLTKEMRIPHETEAKFCASSVMLFPAPGRGLSAGSSVRAVLELGGVRDVGAKLLSRSKNSFNNAQATVKALKKLSV